MNHEPNMNVIYVSASGRRPAYWKVAEHLWGVGCDFDSDGNSKTPDDEEWTELTLIRRDGQDDRVDVDPLTDEQSILVVRSEDRMLAEKVAAFITP